MADTCGWCGQPEFAGEPGDGTCFCHHCIECKFTHDVGPPRSGKARGHIRATKDDIVHVLAWGDDDHCFPACWPYANHEVPLPTTLDYRRTSDPVDCIACIGR